MLEFLLRAFQTEIVIVWKDERGLQIFFFPPSAELGGELGVSSLAH